MPVERLNLKSLEKIFKNNIGEKTTCVVKFYSNQCRFCHALSDEYRKISNSFENVYFFVYNINDGPSIDHLIQINGVPTISVVKTGQRPYVSLLDDPETPHDEMWYYPQDIINFIQKEK